MTTSGGENAGTFLQCPFCASADDWIIEICEPFDAGHIAHIHCTHCGAAGPSGYSATSDDDAIELARRGWRLRAAMLDAIDCRTCKNFTTKSGGCTSVVRCVDGSRYQPHARFQYWDSTGER